MSTTSAYSRLGYVAIKKETTDKVAVKPNVFIPVLKADIVPKYDPAISMPVASIRTLNRNGLPSAIPEPIGKISFNIEPTTIGHFLNGCLGAETVGVYMPIALRLNAGAVTGTPVVGATLAQAVTLAAGTVTAIGAATAYFDLRAVSGSFNSSNVVTGTNPDGTTFTFTPSATLIAGPFTVGETITGTTSAKTAIVLAVSSENDYLLIGTLSGDFTDGERITGGSSSAVAYQISTASSVYGHQFLAPTNTLPTYSMEIGYVDEAVRYSGCRFSELTINQKDNIVVGEVTVTATYEFKMARLTAITTAGAGTKTLTLDQTSGLVVGDTVKVFRPSTGAYLDFSASTVKTHTIATIPDETSITVTNVQVALAVGDLLVLAPQTTSYSTLDEFTWVGASTVKDSEVNMTAALSATAEAIEDFELQLQNEVEARHAANGTNLVNRFPSQLFLKGLKGHGKLHKVYTDMTWLDRVRKTRNLSVQVKHDNGAIGATSNNYILDYRIPKLVFNAFAPVIDSDALLDQEMPYTVFASATSGYTTKVLLVNDTASY